MTRISLLVCFVILVTTAAFATDGVVEINQAKALAGGVTTGDTAGFPVSITLPGSYRLTSNLDVRSISGAANLYILEITSDDVTIDFNGFAIIGPAVCSGTPTSCTGVGTGRSVTISGARTLLKNGTIQGATFYGIFAGPATTVSNMHVESSGNTGIFGNDRLLVENSTISLNGNLGLYVGGYSVVRNNVFSQNKLHGISGPASGTAVIQNNIISGNFGAGINAFGPCSIVGNTIVSNSGFGISNGGGGGHALNVLKNNNGAGAQITGGISMGINVCNGAVCP